MVCIFTIKTKITPAMHPSCWLYPNLWSYLISSYQGKGNGYCSPWFIPFPSHSNLICRSLTGSSCWFITLTSGLQTFKGSAYLAENKNRNLLNPVLKLFCRQILFQLSVFLLVPQRNSVDSISSSLFLFPSPKTNLHIILLLLPHKVNCSNLSVNLNPHRLAQVPSVPGSSSVSWGLIHLPLTRIPTAFFVLVVLDCLLHS